MVTTMSGLSNLPVLCVCVCVCVCVCERALARREGGVREGPEHTHARTHARTHTRARTHARARAHTHCPHDCVFACLKTHTHKTQTHACTHAHSGTRTHLGHHVLLGRLLLGLALRTLFLFLVETEALNDVLINQRSVPRVSAMRTGTSARATFRKPKMTADTCVETPLLLFACDAATSRAPTRLSTCLLKANSSYRHKHQRFSRHPVPEPRVSRYALGRQLLTGQQ